jgi:O-antigen ligase
MNRRIHVEKKVSKAFIIGVPLVTLFFSTSANDPFNVPKQIVLLFICGLLLIPLIHSYKENKFNKSSIEWQVTLLILTFLFFQLLSLALNQNLFTSFFGETSRRNGFITYLCFCMVLFYAMVNLKFDKSTIFLKMLLSTSVPILIYCVFQITGNDFVKWDNPYNAAISTLGNPNFTSAFLSLSFVGALGLIQLKQVKVNWKILATLTCIFIPYVILSSESRQGIYAIVIAIVFYINLRIYLARTKLRVIVYIISLVGLLMSTLGMLQIGPLTNYLYKGSVSIRGYYWRAAIEMFLSNPLKGVGLDQYGLFFREFKEINYVRTYGTDITSTDAHNTFLQMFATGGLGVGVTYLGIVLITYFFSIRMLKKSKDENQKSITIILLCLFTAYNAQSFISISNLGLSIWGWALIGTLLASSNASKENYFEINSGSRKTVKRYKQELLNPFLYFIVLTPILIVSIFMYKSEYNMFILRGLANPNFPNNKEHVIKLSEEIFSNPLADPYLKLRAALYLGDMGMYRDGFTKVEQLKEKSNNNYEVLWVLALFQVQLEKYSDAIDTRLEIANLDPTNTKNYLALMQLYKQLNQNDLMNKMFVKIKSIDSNSTDASSAAEMLIK